MKKYLFPVIIAAMAVLSCGSKEPGQNPAAPAEPTELKVDLTSPTSATLTWVHDGKGVEGWWVFLRKEKEPEGIAPLNQSTPLAAEDRSYTFDKLEKGRSYYFGVRAKGAEASELTVYSELTAIPADEPQPADTTSSDPGTDPTDPVTHEPVIFSADPEAMTASFKSKSSKGEDILITLSKVSANQTVQIDKYQVGNEAFTSYTDWVGPYNMRTIAATTQTEKAWGFTGGWHGSNGDGTGDPTAQTQKIEVSLDGKPDSEGTGLEATVIVYNKVEAANTKFDESKRFVLDEKVTYTFKDSRLYVKVETTALEDVRISIYYGMQIAGGFCSKFDFTTEDGKTTTTTQNYFSAGKTRDMTGYSQGGHSVTAHMFDEGLGTFEKATKSYSALTQYYGANNGKGYYMLIGDKDASSNSYVLKKDETVYWSGYYEFR